MHKLLLISCAFILFSCAGKKDKTKLKDSVDSTSENVKKSTEGSALNWYDLENENAESIKITDELKEISGITFTSDDRLFAHGDEDGDVFQLDYKTGEVVKRFSLGSLLVITGDFEDIAYADGKFYLAESNGKLYEFTEGNNGKFVDYRSYRTSLNSSNDVEGLCYDKNSKSLLLACKESPGKSYGKQKAVYSFSLTSMTFDEKPRFLIDLKSVKKNTAEKEFSPSGIAAHPLTGTFFIIAARGNSIIELDKEGEIINQKHLPESVHKQAEGIAFMKDGTLYISNEGKNKTARLVKYEMKK